MSTNKNEAILANLIASRAKQNPDLDVLTFVHQSPQGELQEEVRSYRQLWQQGQMLAAALQRTGITSGNSFALLMQNHPQFVDAMVGSSIVGSIVVPVDPRTRSKKLAYMLEFAECQGVICADYALSQLLEVLPELTQIEWVWVLDTGQELQLPHVNNKKISWLHDELCSINYELPVAVTDANTPMQMLYTSGTTGDPKAILSSYQRFYDIASIGTAIGLKADDRPYTGLSLTHANAQLISLGNCLKMGLRGVISRKFTKSRLWDITRHYGCTMFNLLGGMTTAIYSSPPQANDRENPVRFVLSAGMPAAIWQDFQQRFNVDVFEFYGAAEGGLTLNPPGLGPIGSIGKPPGSLQAKILDDNDCECEVGVPGEMAFRTSDGSALSVEYFNNPQASKLKVQNGWLRMGDICHQDAQGWFYFDYRKGGGIRHNGDFINTASVEKVIAEHPLVDDVFVYGVAAASSAPGEKYVVAAICLIEGKKEEGASQEKAIADIFTHCHQHLESTAVPRYLQVLDEIPKTASEKPQERFCLEAFRSKPEQLFSEAITKAETV